MIEKIEKKYIHWSQFSKLILLLGSIHHLNELRSRMGNFFYLGISGSRFFLSEVNA